MITMNYRPTTCGRTKMLAIFKYELQAAELLALGRHNI